jgi:hypothetical protein
MQSEGAVGSAGHHVGMHNGVLLDHVIHIRTCRPGVLYKRNIDLENMAGYDNSVYVLLAAVQIVLEVC